MAVSVFFELCNAWDSYVENSMLLGRSVVYSCNFFRKGYSNRKQAAAMTRQNGLEMPSSILTALLVHSGKRFATRKNLNPLTAMSTAAQLFSKSSTYPDIITV